MKNSAALDMEARYNADKIARLKRELEELTGRKVRFCNPETYKVQQANAQRRRRQRLKDQAEAK